MAVDQQSTPGALTGRTRAGRLTGGGIEGNERLTAAAGVLLILLLAVIGLTLLRLRALLSVHLFVGMLLIPPVLLKLASTGYRFTRYYTGEDAYRRKGPPLMGLRLLAPLVVASTVVVFASGVGLLLLGPSSRDVLFPFHKVSFILWVGVTGLHVLAHLPSLPRLLRADHGPEARFSSDVTGRAGRNLALVGALVLGVVLAIVVIPDFGAWLHSYSQFHLHDN